MFGWMALGMNLSVVRRVSWRLGPRLKPLRDRWKSLVWYDVLEGVSHGDTLMSSVNIFLNFS